MASEDRDSRWHQSTLFWGCVSTVVAIVVAVIVAMIKDVRWLLIIAWPFAVFAAWEFARTWGSPGQIKWITGSGSIFAAIALAALYLSLAPAPALLPPATDSSQSTPVPSVPSLLLLYASNQLQLYNRGTSELRLWGDKIDGNLPEVEKDARLIPANGYYYFLTDRLKTVTAASVGANGEILIPFEVYLTDTNYYRWIAKFYLLVEMTNGDMQIHTQQLGVINGDWKAN